MTEPIHFVHQSLWDRLRGLDPNEVSKRAKVEWKERGYLVPFLDELYLVDLKGEFIAVKGKGVSPELQVAVLEYLVGAKELEPSGRWVSLKDLKGGRGFAQSHPLPLELVLRRYGNDPDGFRDKGLALGGEPASYGDLSFILRALPRIPVLLIFWRGDEEFPPRLNFLFDLTASQHMRLDALYGLAIEVIKRYSS